MAPTLEAMCTGRTDEDAVAATRHRSGRSGLLGRGRPRVLRGGRRPARRRRGRRGRVAGRRATTAERFAEHAPRVDNGRARPRRRVRSRSTCCSTSSDIYYFAHWITPVGPPRRYDTRFFVAAAPPEQVPLHDDRETIATIWINPPTRSTVTKRGELELIFPTIKNLEAISRFDTAAGSAGGGGGDRRSRADPAAYRERRARAAHPAAGRRGLRRGHRRRSPTAWSAAVTRSTVARSPGKSGSPSADP